MITHTAYNPYGYELFVTFDRSRSVIYQEVTEEIWLEFFYSTDKESFLTNINLKTKVLSQEKFKPL